MSWHGPWVAQDLHWVSLFCSFSTSSSWVLKLLSAPTVTLALAPLLTRSPSPDVHSGSLSFSLISTILILNHSLSKSQASLC